MGKDFIAGASAARNKLASYLRENGFNVKTSNYGNPPTDDDFLKAVLEARNEVGKIKYEENVVIIFKWWQSKYQILIPNNEIKYLIEDKRRKYNLFTATSPGGSNNFYLTSNENGEIIVNRKKDWRKKVEEIDTTILEIKEKM